MHQQTIPFDGSVIPAPGSWDSLMAFQPGGVTYVDDFGVSPTPLEPADMPNLIVGDYFVQKYRERAAAVGVPIVAKQLRKQGVDVEIAVLILAVRQ